MRASTSTIEPTALVPSLVDPAIGMSKRRSAPTINSGERDFTTSS